MESLVFASKVSELRRRCCTFESLELERAGIVYEMVEVGKEMFKGLRAGMSFDRVLLLRRYYDDLQWAVMVVCAAEGEMVRERGVS